MVTDRELVKLREELDRWVAQGVISPERRDAILAEVSSRPEKARRGGLSVMPFIMGVLIAAGATVLVMGFADPALIPRPLAVLILIISIIGALFLAQWLSGRERTVSSQLAVVAGLGLFGAGLFFITNVYFIHVHPPDLVVIWALGALIAAIVLPSRGALAAGIVTATVWSLMEVLNYRTIFHWEYLPLWAVAFGWTISLRWRTGMHLSAVGLLCWMSVNLFTGAKLAHLNLLPQGQSERYKRAEAMVDTMDEHFGSCTNHGECEAACPKEISIDVIAVMNSDYLASKFKNRKSLSRT